MGDPTHKNFDSGSEGEGTDKRSVFNKDALPFVPSTYNAQVPTKSTPPMDYPLLINFSNIPSEISQEDFIEFMKECIQDIIDEDPESFSVPDLNVEFNIINYQPVKFFDAELNSDKEFVNCLIDMGNYPIGMKLTENLDGYNWMDNYLDTKIVPSPMFNPYINYFYPAMSQSPLTSGTPPHFGAIPRPYVQPLMYGGTAVGSAPGTRSNSLSTLKPHSSSFSSATPSSTSRRSSGSSLQSNDSITGVPQFVMNFVKRGEDNQIPGEFMIIKNEDGNPIKVNTCRLFVGNIPFTSTWSGLKSFLITKCQELEPDNDIEILRVEIPMHPNSRVNLVLSEKIEGSSIDENIDEDSAEAPAKHRPYQKSMSRGFAIVTTGNQASSEKIIKYFDGIEFEGRILTVRFDRFPDYNNYVLQQLYPVTKDKALTNLAFERNSFNQSFYYGNYQTPPSRSNSFSQPYRNNQYQHGFQHHNNHGSSRVSASPMNQNPQSHGTHSYSGHQNHYQSPNMPILQPNFVPQIHPSVRYTNTLSIPRSIKKKLEPDASINTNLNEDEKARDLVNSFKSLGMTS